MKRLLASILLLQFLLLLLNSCVSIPGNMIPSESADAIQAIEIYHLRAEDFETEVIPERVRETVSPVHVLPKDQHEAFLSDLESMEFVWEFIVGLPIDYANDYLGYMVIIVYDENHYDVFSDFGQTYYSKERGGKEGYYFCEEEAWNAMIRRYLPTVDSETESAEA